MGGECATYGKFEKSKDLKGRQRLGNANTDRRGHKEMGYEIVECA